MKATKQQRITQLQAILLTHFDDKVEMSKPQYRTVNEDFWSLADLIARQWKNNYCDGFGMVNIEQGYDFIIEHLDELKKLNMISESGKNNSGCILWERWELQ